MRNSLLHHNVSAKVNMNDHNLHCPFLPVCTVTKTAYNNMFIKTIILPFLIFLLCYSLSASGGHTHLHPLRVSSVNIQNPGYKPVITQPVITRSPHARCRPGPKPKPLTSHVLYKLRGPIKRVHRAYS